MSKLCGLCGTENSNNATKCVGCGSPFFQNKLDKIERDMIERF